MQRHDYIDYTNHGFFSSGRARFLTKKIQKLFREKPPPFRMQVAIQWNHLHLIIQSNHVHLMCWRCSSQNRSIGHLVSPASPRSRDRLRQRWLMFAIPQATKRADLNIARMYEAKYQQSRFQCHTCYLKEKNQGPNLHLTETSHTPFFRYKYLFVHSRQCSRTNPVKNHKWTPSGNLWQSEMSTEAPCIHP